MERLSLHDAYAVYGFISAAELNGFPTSPYPLYFQHDMRGSVRLIRSITSVHLAAVCTMSCKPYAGISEGTCARPVDVHSYPDARKPPAKDTVRRATA